MLAAGVVLGANVIGTSIIWVMGYSGSSTDGPSVLSAIAGMFIGLSIALFQIARVYRLFCPPHQENHPT
jgi:hypothetical protein